MENGIYWEYDHSFMSLDEIPGVTNLFLKFYTDKKYTLSSMNVLPNEDGQCKDDQNMELVFTRL